MAMKVNHLALPKSRGFSLVELLVVVSIIAILVTLGMISYLSIQKNARDAKRQSDLNTVRSALEQYHADWGFYPDRIDFTQPDRGLTKTGGNQTKNYLTTLPTEPKPSDTQKQYCYKATPDGCSNSGGNNCTRYNLYAVLEKGGTPVSCGGVSGYNYMVTLP
jgi:prepilin-type N-terminal cleavage/methylation domain-containing protein